ncbi:MAG: phosphoribosylformylglycinamidine cyclo-ligase [Thermodesulfobacteriota bacterium]
MSAGRGDGGGGKTTAGATYAATGVDVLGLEPGLGRLVARLAETNDFPRRGRPVLPNGFFANVLDLGHGQGLAISTDGVGTKLLVALALRRFETIAIDLIAMNVNDVLCVGAEPIALVDYVAVSSTDPVLLDQLSIGLVEGARQARISIPGGEIAQVRELLRPHPPDGREGFDVVATAVGVVPLDRVIIGRDVVPGDVVIGLPSSGVHSNGLTLARRVLGGEGGAGYDERPDALGGRTVGEELLRPTRIYVREVMALLDACVAVRALAHVTGDGLLNLLRIAAREVGFVLDALPQPQPVFDLIATRGGVAAAEMYATFNMGVGFCVVVAERDAERALGLLREVEPAAAVLGRAVADRERKLVLPGPGLVGTGKSFRPLADAPQ